MKFLNGKCDKCGTDLVYKRIKKFKFVDFDNYPCTTKIAKHCSCGHFQVFEYLDTPFKLEMPAHMTGDPSCFQCWKVSKKQVLTASPYFDINDFLIALLEGLCTARRETCERTVILLSRRHESGEASKPKSPAIRLTWWIGVSKDDKRALANGGRLMKGVVPEQYHRPTLRALKDERQ